MNMATEQTDTATATVPTDPYHMSQDQVAAKLKQLSVDYHRKYDAPKSQLADRYEGNQPRIDRLFNGDRAEGQKFSGLLREKIEASPVEAAMEGTIGDVPSSDLRQMAVGAGWLRNIGVSEGAIKEMLSGRQAPPEEYEAVKRWKSDALRNPEWTKKLLSGDQEAQRQLVLANIVLTNGVLEAA
jgi:hypothetical protein